MRNFTTSRLYRKINNSINLIKFIPYKIVLNQQIMKYMKKIILNLSCLLSLFSLSVNATANNEQRRQEIYQTVESFLSQQLIAKDDEKIEITVNRIDSRIKIQPCAVPLTVALAGKSKLVRNTTVQVKCGHKWKMYVPARIKRLQKLVVASQNIAAGTLLSNTNLVIAYHDVLTLRGSSIDAIDIISGSKIKRYVAQGQAITNNLVCLVCKGDPVTIYARAGSLTIKSVGVAQKDGSLGQNIAVRNTS